MDYIALTHQFSPRNYEPLPVVISEAEGVWVKDVEGKKYLDMLSCYSALNFGHRHTKIIQAFVNQINRLTLTSRAVYTDAMAIFCKELAEFCQMELVLLMNTGAEAVETAVKTARKWGYEVKGVPKYEAEIIVCENNFHGRTTTIISFSSEELYKKQFGPFTPGFKMIPYADIEALSKAISKNTVAFLVEPIQGEGGVVVPPEGYLKQVHDICKQNNILFMLDEIQTGLGRTGKRFAWEWEGAKPDVLILGKALGGGVYPVSAVVSSKKILGLYKPGEHGSTFGGNPLASAVGIASIRLLVEEDLCKNADEIGKYFIKRLKEIKNPAIKEVRGKGLLIGMELNAPARPYCERLLKEGLICKETHERVIRFAPPLIIKKQEIDQAINKIKKIFETS
jgi:ornithine--oxo-acid transaminase